MNFHEIWSLRERGLSGFGVRAQQSNWWSKRNCPVCRTVSSYDHASKFSANPLMTSGEAVSETISCRLPSLLNENKIKLGRVNKAFASEWLDPHRVILGTKCNRLIVVDTKPSTSRSVAPDQNNTTSETSAERSQITLVDSLQSSAETLWNAQEGHSGIHSVRINPSATRLATGAECPSDVAVYSLPDLKPVTVGECGHASWMFDLHWMDDELAVSGSRDGSIALWRFQDQQEEGAHCSHVQWVRMAREGRPPARNCCWKYPTTKALATKRLGQHFERVRTLVFSRRRASITCASLSSHMCIVDATTLLKRGKTKTLDSSEFSETVCLCHSSDENCMALGSRAHFTVFESESLRSVADVPLPEGPANFYPGMAPSGVRSISWRGPIITVGTGGGELLFFDVRMSRFLQCSGQLCRRNVTLRVGGGYMEDDEILDEVLTGGDCPTAIYTHAYDADQVRLFAAGGPIAASVQGNYAAVWQ